LSALEFLTRTRRHDAPATARSWQTAMGTDARLVDPAADPDAKARVHDGNPGFTRAALIERF
jgi:hypothetical protein